MRIGRCQAQEGRKKNTATPKKERMDSSSTKEAQVRREGTTYVKNKCTTVETRKKKGRTGKGKKRVGEKQKSILKKKEVVPTQSRGKRRGVENRESS